MYDLEGRLYDDDSPAPDVIDEARADRVRVLEGRWRVDPELFPVASEMDRSSPEKGITCCRAEPEDGLLHLKDILSCVVPAWARDVRN